MRKKVHRRSFKKRDKRERPEKIVTAERGEKSRAKELHQEKIRGKGSQEE